MSSARTTLLCFELFIALTAIFCFEFGKIHYPEAYTMHTRVIMGCCEESDSEGQANRYFQNLFPAARERNSNTAWAQYVIDIHLI